MMIGILMLAAAQVVSAAPNPPSAPAVASADGFQVGQDTLATVTAKLGKPFTVIHASDGTSTAIYSVTRTHVKASTFIPVVGLFTGGAKGSVSTKTFVFDVGGVLKSYSSSDTDTNCHLGFAGTRCD